MERAAARPDDVVATYVELAPRAALRAHVRFFFAFGPAGTLDHFGDRIVRRFDFAPHESYSGPMLATAEASIVVARERVCRDWRWESANTGAEAQVIGATSRVAAAGQSEFPEMFGVYLRPGRLADLAREPAHALADQVVPLSSLDNAWAREILDGVDATGDGNALDALERALLRRVDAALPRYSRLDLPRLCAWIRRSQGAVGVDEAASAAGVSRQHLTRQFNEMVGVSAKVFGRLARFHAALGHVERGARIPWVRVAAAAGYADQSHMIAEFRQFSGLTPTQLAADNLFHPFIDRPG